MQEISAAVLAVVNWCIYLLLYLRYILTPSVIRQKKKKVWPSLDYVFLAYHELDVLVLSND